MQPLTLYELNNRVRVALGQAFPDEYWVQAELSDVRVNPAGHCYVEFVQKDARNHAMVAKARGTVWSNVFRLLRPYFERETGQPFVAGIKVQVKVRVEFHELYGYSLMVVDIDPSYTVGDMVRRRREILRQLEEEGVLSLNKELQMPVVPQRIAVISSATAAGYGDFCNQLENNPHGFRFTSTLFPAVMQGEKVEESVLDALELIHENIESWDVVVIIRGGGAVSDLAGFDTYLLAAACAQFPLPIITGIGHERDDTVLDMVAHTRVKTPTAAAEYLISCVQEVAMALEAKADYIHEYVRYRLQQENFRLEQIASRLPSVLALRQLHETHRINDLCQRRDGAVGQILQLARHRLQILEQRVSGCDYHRLLMRGFSLTVKDGHIVTDASQVCPGDVVVTRLGKGCLKSKILQVEHSEKK